MPPFGSFVPDDEAHARAAERTRRSVRHGGEGMATRLPEALVTHLLGLPKRAFEEAGRKSMGLDYSFEPIGDAAMLGMTGGMPFAQSGAAGIFGGRLSQTADHAKMARAEVMERAGKNRDDILSQTGWFRGADHHWRYEIPDNLATMNSAALKKTDLAERASDVLRTQGTPYSGIRDPGLPKEAAIEAIKTATRDGHGTIPMSNYLSHGDIYAAYPGLREMPVGTEMSLTARGRYSPETDRIFTRGGDNVLHELQHAIQKREGFAAGGSPEMFKAEYHSLNKKVDELNAAMSAASRAGDKVTYHRLMDERSAIVPRIQEIQGKHGIVGEEPYRRLAGEVEARNVQKRMPMTPEERRATPPWATEDVPVGQQIVRFGEPNAMMDVSRAAYRKQFDTPAYHGTTEFEGAAIHPESTLRPFYSSASPGLASEYATITGRGNPQVIPLALNAKDYARIDAGGKFYTNPAVDDMVTAAKKQGKPGAIIENFRDRPHPNLNDRPETVYVTFPDGRDTVRSRFAAFDPANAGSGMLLGSGSTDKRLSAALASRQLNTDPSIAKAVDTISGVSDHMPPRSFFPTEGGYTAEAPAYAQAARLRQIEDEARPVLRSDPTFGSGSTDKRFSALLAGTMTDRKGEAAMALYNRKIDQWENAAQPQRAALEKEIEAMRQQLVKADVLLDKGPAFGFAGVPASGAAFGSLAPGYDQ